MTAEKITQGNVLELWASKYESVTLWLNHLQQKALNAFSLYRFCIWAQKSPDDLLAEKTQDPSANSVEKLLDKFCNTPDPHFTNSFRYQASIAVKSYFRWNYHDLAKAAGQVTLEKKKAYNKLSKDGLRRIWNWTRNPRDRALIPFVTSTAIAKETLSNLTWGLLEDGWETKEFPAIEIPSELLKGHGIGRYRGVKQVTFLTNEARRALSDYKDWIEKRLGRKVNPDDKIWRDTRTPYPPLEYSAFASLILRISKESGVPFTWHDGRRWLTTALEQVGLSPNWNRVLRGRKVSGSESPYSRPAIEALRAKFAEAAPLLEFITESRPEVPKEVLDRIQKLEAERQQIRDVYKMRTAKQAEHAAKKAQKCKDGEHCENFAEIKESELLDHLRAGWTIVKELSDGSLIVKRIQ
jgi:hypothetical protein